MTRRLSALVLWILAIQAAHAQTRPALLEPVHWYANAQLPDRVVPGTRLAVLLHANIDEGWHLYALPDRETFPLATEVALAKNPAVDLLRVEEERPHHSIDPESHVVTGWFAQSATFTLRLVAVTDGPRDLQVLVRYQACNDRVCLPAKQVVVPVQSLPSR